MVQIPTNIRVSITTPNYTNLRLYDDGYAVTISLHISEKSTEFLNVEEHIYPIIYRGKHYLHWENFYSYSIPFGTAYTEAYKALTDMKVLIRNAKIALLKREIDSLLAE